VPYTVEIHREARRAMKALSDAESKVVSARIDALAEDPLSPDSKALKGKHAGKRRVRVGVYRIVYAVERNVLRVLVLRVGHRRDIYR
jgi:mRNA interferase RelE/StbE